MIVPSINSALGVYSISMSADELTAFVTGSDNGSDYTLKMTTRPSNSMDFPAPTADAALASILAGTGNEAFPSTRDALTLYFSRTNPSTFTTTISVATSGSTSGAFTAGAPVTVDGVALTEALHPHVSANGMTLYWVDETDLKLRSAAVGGSIDAFFQRKVESTMSTGGGEYAISPDELTLYYGGSDVIVSTRASKNVAFEPGSALGAVNSSQLDQATHSTSDGCLLFLTTQRSGGVGNFNIWVARRAQ